MTTSVQDRLSTAANSDTISNLSPEFIKARDDFAAWYDAKSEDMQSLIDEISDCTCFIIDEDEYDEFIAELDAYDITDASSFEEAFMAEYEGTSDRVLELFAEQFCDDLGYTNGLHDLLRGAVDYETVWYQSLQHDFFTIEFKGNTYFFTRHY